MSTGVVFADRGSLQVTRSPGVASARVLLLHLGNAVGSQAQSVAATWVAPTLQLQKGSGVSIAGTPKVGSKLKAGHGKWNGTGVTYSYRWLRDGKAVTNATGSSYTLGSADAGHRMSVTVVAKATGYQDGTATSKPTVKVAR